MGCGASKNLASKQIGGEPVVATENSAVEQQDVYDAVDAVPSAHNQECHTFDDGHPLQEEEEDAHYEKDSAVPLTETASHQQSLSYEPQLESEVALFVPSSLLLSDNVAGGVQGNHAAVSMTSMMMSVPSEEFHGRRRSVVTYDSDGDDEQQLESEHSLLVPSSLFLSDTVAGGVQGNPAPVSMTTMMMPPPSDHMRNAVPHNDAFEDDAVRLKSSFLSTNMKSSTQLRLSSLRYDNPVGQLPLFGQFEGGLVGISSCDLDAEKLKALVQQGLPQFIGNNHHSRSSSSSDSNQCRVFPQQPTQNRESPACFAPAQRQVSLDSKALGIDAASVSW